MGDKAKMAWLISEIASSFPTAASANQDFKIEQTNWVAAGAVPSRPGPPCTRIFLVLRNSVAVTGPQAVVEKAYLTLSTSPPAVKKGMTVKQMMVLLVVITWPPGGIFCNAGTATARKYPGGCAIYNDCTKDDLTNRRNKDPPN